MKGVGSQSGLVGCWQGNQFSLECISETTRFRKLILVWDIG